MGDALALQERVEHVCGTLRLPFQRPRPGAASPRPRFGGPPSCARWRRPQSGQCNHGRPTYVSLALSDIRGCSPPLIGLNIGPGSASVLNSALGAAVVETAWIAVLAIRLGRLALESRSLGLGGFGDSSVHRWRRSEATALLPHSLEDYDVARDPVRVTRSSSTNWIFAALDSQDDAGATAGRPIIPRRCLSFYLYSTHRSQSSRRLGTRSSAQYRADLPPSAGAGLQDDWPTYARTRVAAIRAVCGQFVALLPEGSTHFTRAIVAIAASKFKA